MSQSKTVQGEPAPLKSTNGSIETEPSAGREKRTQFESSKDPMLHVQKKVRFNDVDITHEFATAEQDMQDEDRVVQLTEEGEGDSPDCGGHVGEDEALDDLQSSMYGRDEVNKIRQRRKQNANRAHLGEFRDEDVEIDVVNSRAAAQAAQEADPEEHIGDGGILMEPFNMRREMEEGSFDDDGNYVWNKRGKNEHVTDGWLDSVDAGDSFSNFATEEKRLRAVAPFPEHQQPQEMDIAPTLRELSSLLKNMETPAAALKRLKQTTEGHVTPLKSAAQDRQRKVVEEALRKEGLTKAGGEALRLPSQSGCASTPKTEQGSGGSVSPTATLHPTTATDSPSASGERRDESLDEKTFQVVASNTLSEAKPRGRVLKGRLKMTEEAAKDFDRITELCDTLMARGRHVYFMPRPEILQAATDVEEGDPSESNRAVYKGQATEAHTRIYWQFRWTGNRSGEEPHGPFESAAMQAWMDEGFFSETTPVEVRQVSESNDPLDGLWRSWQDVNFCHVTESIADGAEGGEPGQPLENHEISKALREDESPDSPGDDSGL